MSRPASPNAHEWALRQLLAYSAGMLPEDELLRLEEHLGTCPDCRSRLAPLKPAAGVGAGHLPASLIATWPRSSAQLEGLERELVEAHLADCEACRATITFAGHEPALSPAADAAARGAGGSAKAARSSRVWMWALGLLGAAAGVAAWLLAAHPAALRGAGERVLGLSRARTDVTFELALDSLTTGAIRLPQPGFRDTPSRPLEIGVVTNVSGVVFILPPALQPPTPEAGERRITITFLRDGRELGSHAGPFYALGDAIRLRPRGRLDAGDYDLRFALAPETATDPPLVWFYRMRLR